MNLAAHSFDCPVKHDAEHDPRVCAADDGLADAHEREIDWYERHLAQAQAEIEWLRAALIYVAEIAERGGQVWAMRQIYKVASEALGRVTAD